MLMKIYPEEILKDIIQKYEPIKDNSINDYFYIKDIKDIKKNVNIDLYTLIYSINCMVNVIKKKDIISQNIDEIDNEYKNKIKYLELEIENNIHNNDKLKEHIKDIEESYKNDKNDKNKTIQKLKYKIDELENIIKKDNKDKLENDKIVKINCLNDHLKDIANIDNNFIDSIYRLYILDKNDFVKNINAFCNIHNELNNNMNEDIYNKYNENNVDPIF